MPKAAVIEQENPLTFFYGHGPSRTVSAQKMIERFKMDVRAEPTRAYSQLLGSIDSALGQAFAQGSGRKRT